MPIENALPETHASETYSPRAVELARAMEHMEDEETLRAHLGELLELISRDVGAEFIPNPASLYKKMREEDCLVRVEHLSRVLETVETAKPLKIADEHETHYANAVIPVPEGIKIAFSEGLAPGPIRMMVAFGKTIIGFKSDTIKVDDIEFSESDIRDKDERKYLCRHISGELKKEDIRYLVMRIPFHLVDEGHLTPDEQRRKPSFIFRGLEFPHA